MTNKKPQATNFGYWNELLKNAPGSYLDFLEAEQRFVLDRVYGGRVLDFGCGDGRILGDLFANGRSRGLYGIDIDPEAVLAAREKLSHHVGISVLNEDARYLPFRNGTFYTILCLNFATNFGEERDKFYQEMKRVVAFGGSILLSVFNEDAFDERIKLYKKAKAPIDHVNGTTVYFDYKEGLHPSEQFSRSQLEKIFDENNLCPFEINKHGIGYLCRLKKK